MSVLAAVASQPAMPFFKQGALHMSPREIASSREALETKGPMRVLRFEHSVLTLDFVDEAGHPTREALQNVLAYFDEKLNP